MVLPSQASTVPAAAFAVTPSRQLIAVGHYPVTRVIELENVGPKSLTLDTRMMVGTELLHGGFTWANPVAPVAQGTSWLTASPSSITLAPNQVGHVTVSITVPRGHQPGEHFLGVDFYEHAGNANSAKGKVKTSEAVTAGVVSELLINTTGKVRNGPISQALSAPGFSMGGPINLTASIKNAGNTYYLNNALVAKSGSDKIPFNGVLVLGGAARAETATWSSPPTFGFPAHLALMANGRQVGSASVWIVPVPQLGGALAALIGLVLIVIFMRKRRNHVINREVERLLNGVK